MAKRGSKLAKKAKKKGLAPSKRYNIRNLKRIKNKEFTPAERKARREARSERKKLTYSELRKKQIKELRAQRLYENDEEVYPLTKEVTGEEMLSMIDPEDVSYMAEHYKDLDLEEDEEETKDAVGQSTEEKAEGSVPEEKEEDEDKEKEFELKERSFNPMGNDMKTLLPFKTKSGVVQRYTKRDVEDEVVKGKKGKIAEETSKIQPPVDDDAAPKKKKKEEVVTKTVVDLMAERQEKLDRKKVAIGCMAVNFLELPHERMHCLNSLINMLNEEDISIRFTIRKYTAMSLLEIFHRTIPGYHIAPHDLTQKLKKETKEQYLYENYILKSYQSYLKELEKFLKEERNKKGDPPVRQLALVALKSMSELLEKHKHFTYTNNIIAALIPYLSSKDEEMCKMIWTCFTNVFKDDVKGDVSLEAVKRIDHFVRKRNFHVRVECLSVLLHLRIKDVKSLDDEMEAKNIAKNKLSHTEKLMRKLQEERASSKKSNKEAKKYRKFRKLEEQRKEHQMKQQEEVRSAQHTQIIEILFGLYFHILKRRPNRRLNAIVLEGLAKYSHLVNIEFFSDLLNVLGGLMEEGTLKFRESLHCIQTVFTILSDQGEVLTIDPRRFYTYLYANLFKITGGDNQDDIKSAFASIMLMMVTRRKRVTAARITAFLKRLTTLSTSLLHNGAISSLAAARHIMLAHPSSEVLLEVDSEGAIGVFNPEASEPEHCNATATTLWELHLVNHHYHPVVRQFAEHLSNGCPLQGDRQLPANIGKRRVEDLYDDFDPSLMKFNPPVLTPSQIFSNRKTHEELRRNIAKRKREDQWSTQYMTKEIKSIVNEDVMDDIASPSKTTGKFKKRNAFNRIEAGIDLDDVNYHRGVLPNISLKKIKLLDHSNVEDMTESLVDVDTVT